MNDICRVCLSPTLSKKHSNLFFAAGRSTQLWAKIMACAWVQVFDGDGLPGQICYKCHNKLDIAYHFKQQCEAADAQLRQFLARNMPSKSNTHNTMDIPQEQRECLMDRKPLNFVANERFDLPQCDLTLNALRLLNQELPFLQNIDLRITEGDLNIAKQEPDSFITSNADENVLSMRNGFDLNTAFKSESFNDTETLINGTTDKLFASVASTEETENGDCKGIVWDLQNKQILTTKLMHNDGVLSMPIPDLNLKALDNVTEDNDKADESNLSFLDDRSDSSFNEARTALYKNLLNASNIINAAILDNEKQFEDAVCLKIDKSSSEINNCINPRVDNAIEAESIQPLLSDCVKDNVAENNIMDKESQEQCNLCGKIFKYRGYMKQHLRTHEDLKPFSCDQCDEKFSWMHSLVSHRRVHTGEKPYICATCGKRFTQSSSVKAHMRLHTGEKPFKCDICFKQFNQKSNLQTHKLSHSGQRLYTCKICDKAFKCQKHLQSHQKLHENRKEFQCSICQKSFQRKSYLRIHLDIHSGRKPFRCKECGHSFSNASNLKSHVRIHTGIKPYSCHVCKRSFTQSNGLARHMQQNHNQEYLLT